MSSWATINPRMPVHTQSTKRTQQAGTPGQACSR